MRTLAGMRVGALRRREGGGNGKSRVCRARAGEGMDQIQRGAVI